MDVSLRKTAGIVTGSISGFYTRFSDFIAFTPTPLFIDDLQVFIYTPRNAEFYGGEGQVQFHFLPLTLASPGDQVASVDPKSVRSVIAKETPEPQKNPKDLYLQLRADYVHAEDTEMASPCRASLRCVTASR